MKRKLLVVLILISIMSVLIGVAANPLQSRSFYLAEVRFVGGKGVVFLFNTVGKFTKSDLDTAYAYVGGNSLDVHCVIKNGQDQIACTVKTINQYAGQSVVIGLLGQGFWATVPEKPVNCLGFAVTHPQSIGQIAYIPFWWNFVGADTPEEVMALFESNGWIIVDRCVTDPGLYPTPQG